MKVWIVTQPDWEEIIYRGAFSSQELAENYASGVCERLEIKELAIDEHAGEMLLPVFEAHIMAHTGEMYEQEGVKVITHPYNQGWVRLEGNPDNERGEFVGVSTVLFMHAIEMARKAYADYWEQTTNVLDAVTREWRPKRDSDYKKEIETR